MARRRSASAPGATPQEQLPTYDQLMMLMQDTQFDEDRTIFNMAAEAIQKGEYEKQSEVESLARGVGQGLTFGFSDEALAGLRAMGGQIKEAFGDGEDTSFFDMYQAKLADERAALEAARRDNPYYMMAGELGGGMLTGGAGLARTVGKNVLLPAIAKGMGAGAGMGGLAGFGYSEADPLALQMAGADPEDIAQARSQAGGEALIGATLGAGGGALAPLVGKGAQMVGRGVAKALPGGRATISNEAARREVADAVQADMARQNITPQQVREALAENEAMRLGDLGIGTRDLVQRTGQTTTPGGQELRAMLVERNRDTAQRIIPKITQKLGQKTSNMAEAADEYFAEHAAKAKEAYRQAESISVDMTPEMKRILTQTPEGKTALRIARQNRQSRTQTSPDPADVKADADYILQVNRPQSTKDLDAALRSLKGQATDAYKSGGAKSARGPAIQRNADAFERELYDQNDAYRIARETYGTKQSNEEAFEYGTKIFSNDPNRVEIDLRNMTDADREMVRMGTLKAAAERLKRRPYDADTTKAVLNSQQDEEVLRQAFGDARAFDDFVRYIDGEQKMFEAYKLGATGSPTAKLQQGQIDAVTKALEYGMYTAGLQTGTGGARAMGALGKAIGQNLRDPAAVERDAQRFISQQAQHLMGRDLDALLVPNRVVQGLFDPTVPAMPARAVGGVMASGYPQVGTQYGLPE